MHLSSRLSRVLAASLLTLAPWASSDADAGERTSPERSSEARSSRSRTVDRYPELLSLPAPVYPESARRERLEGVVVLDLLVGVRGQVESVEIVEGAPVLAAAAVLAARDASFRPGLRHDRPIQVWVRLPVRFELDGAHPSGPVDRGAKGL